MKKIIKSIHKEIKIISLFLFILGLISAEANTLNSNLIENDSTKFSQFKGKVSDSRTKNELSFATLSLIGENISTVTNSEGEFSIKVPNNKLEGRLLISFIGYKNKTINLRELKSENNAILLEPSNIALGEVIVSTNNANQLIKQVLSKIDGTHYDASVLIYCDRSFAAVFIFLMLFAFGKTFYIRFMQAIYFITDTTILW